MFETLFTYPLNLARHRTAPCPETRESFLVHCAEQGYPHASLKKIAWILLVFSQSIDLCRPGRITTKEIGHGSISVNTLSFIDFRNRPIRNTKTVSSQNRVFTKTVLFEPCPPCNRSLMMINL